MDVRLPDGRVVKNVPDGMTKSQLAAKLERNGISVPREGVKGTGTYGLPKAKGGLENSFLRGSTFGLLDEVAGGTGAVVDAIRAPFSDQIKFDPVKSYQAWRDRSRGEARETNKAHPIAATALEVAGGMGNVPAKALKALTTGKAIVKGGMFGAGAGGLAGFGSGEGLENSISGAQWGATIGAPIGAAAPVVLPPLVSALGKGVAATANGARRLIGRPVAKAAPNVALGRQVVAKAMAEDALTPLRAGKALDEANARGVPLALGDLGDNLRGLTGSISRKPGKARTLVREMVDARQMAQNERVRGAMSRDMGEIANTFEQGDALMKQARRNAAPLYVEAYSAPPISSPKLEGLLGRPAARTALARARTIAANEGRDPQGLGFALDEQGDVVLNPSNLNVHDSLAQARSIRDDLALELENARKKAGASLMPHQSSNDIPVLEAQLAKADEVLEARTAELSSAPTPDVAATTRAYSPQTIDYVKRGIDDQLEPYRNEFTGNLELDEYGKSVDQVRRELLGEVDTLNPAYPKARASWAGPASAKQAMEKGKKALNYSDQEIERATMNLSEGDRQQFALGFRSAMAEAMDRRVDGADKVAALLGSPRKRKALAQVFGGEEGLDNFLRTMADERLGNETYRAVRGGPATAERVAEDENTGNLVEQGGLAAYNAVRGNVPGLLRQGYQAAQDFRRFGAGKAAERAREDAAALLTETDPIKLRESLREALRNQAILRAQLATRRKGGVAASVGAGELAGSIMGPAQ